MEEFVYLTYYQSMSILYRLQEIKDENPEFSNEEADVFTNYVIERTLEITRTQPQIKLYLTPHGNKYKVAKDVMDYLTEITGINVGDPKTLRKYTKLVKEYEANLLKQSLEKNKELLKKSN